MEGCGCDDCKRRVVVIKRWGGCVFGSFWIKSLGGYMWIICTCDCMRRRTLASLDVDVLNGALTSQKR